MLRSCFCIALSLIAAAPVCAQNQTLDVWPGKVPGESGEIAPDKVTFTQGMDFSIGTSTRSDDEARKLLKAFGMPFRE